MGGTFTIVLYADARPLGDRAATAAFTELRRLERMLSHYRADSEWSAVNRHAAERAVPVPQELFELLAASIDYSRRSEGAFDITVGPLVRAWDFKDGTGRLASDEAIQRARRRVGYANVVLDAASRTVRFSRSGVELDPSGIGKGYAVDRMIVILRQHGISRALVSAADSSIYAMGAPPGKRGWMVRVGGPVTGSEQGPVLLENKSLSTSGASRKSFRVQDQRYGHVLDPRTGYPAPGYLAAVVAPRTLDSEAWTKAVLVNGSRWAAKHTPRGWRAFYCASEHGSSCTWVTGAPGAVAAQR
jgi:thiamine biosynthesis lipoprotein